MKTFNDMGYMRPVQVQIREFDIIQKLKHKNIVKLIGIEEEVYMYRCMPYIVYYFVSYTYYITAWQLKRYSQLQLSTKANVIIMELCTGGSLLNILDDPENAFGLPDCEFLIVLHDVGNVTFKLFVVVSCA